MEETTATEEEPVENTSGKQTEIAEEQLVQKLK